MALSLVDFNYRIAKDHLYPSEEICGRTVVWSGFNGHQMTIDIDGYLSVDLGDGFRMSQRVTLNEWGVPSTEDWGVIAQLLRDKFADGVKRLKLRVESLVGGDK